MRILLLSFITVLSLTACREGGTSYCDDKKWDSWNDFANCKWPYPPHGRWHAVYTKEFADEHNLPLENISKDLSPGIDYIEMDVQPYAKDGTACFVNMLVKKPHDIAMYKSDTALTLPRNRDLLHLIDINKHKEKLKPIITFRSASRDYKFDERGYMALTSAMYAENVLPEYDYFTAHKYCRDISRHSSIYPDGYAFRIAKASVWGRYERSPVDLNEKGRPKSEAFSDSHFFINIPEEIVRNIYKDIPLGGL